MVSVGESIRRALSPGKTVQEVISGSEGDYNSTARVIENNYGDYDLQIGSKVFDRPGEIIQKLQESDAEISSNLQKILGQNPSDTNVDDFDDALKVIGPSNITLRSEGFSIQKKAKETINKTAENETVQNLSTVSSAILAVIALGSFVTAYFWRK